MGLLERASHLNFWDSAVEARGTASLRALSWVFAWHVVQQEGQCVGAERARGLSRGGRRLDGVRGTAGEESVGKYYYQVQVTWGNWGLERFGSECQDWIQTRLPPRKPKC